MGRSDEEIREFLELKGRVPWKEDLDHLGGLFGFVSSRPFMRMSIPFLSEEEQIEHLEDQANC